jgi:hypothetical protein
MNYRRIATFTGWLWIITFLTSIPARLFFYAPVLEEEGNYVTGAGMEAVKALLGHQSLATTLDTYGHLTVEDARTTLEGAGWFTGREVRL